MYLIQTLMLRTEVINNVYTIPYFVDCCMCRGYQMASLGWVLITWFGLTMVPLIICVISFGILEYRRDKAFNKRYDNYCGADCGGCDD